MDGGATTMGVEGLRAVARTKPDRVLVGWCILHDPDGSVHFRPKNYVQCPQRLSFSRTALNHLDSDNEKLWFFRFFIFFAVNIPALRASTSVADIELPKFRVQTIDGKVAIGYGTAIGDVDGDGRIDIVAAGRSTRNLLIPALLMSLGELRDAEKTGHSMIAPAH